MAKALNRSEVIKMLKKRQAGRTNQDFAVELGISKQYLGDIYLGRREPGPTILRQLGLKQAFVAETVS